MVSSCSLKEVNRLREAYHSELLLYVIPSSAKSQDKQEIALITVQEHHNNMLLPPLPALV